MFGSWNGVMGKKCWVNPALSAIIELIGMKSVMGRKTEKQK